MVAMHQKCHDSIYTGKVTLYKSAKMCYLLQRGLMLHCKARQQSMGGSKGACYEPVVQWCIIATHTSSRLQR